MKKTLFTFFIIAFMVISCDKSKEDIDPCAEVTCINGYCDEGSCICDEGYKGETCSEEITPTKMTITKIKLTKFPLYNNGSDWDTWSSYPDIYFVLTKNNNVIYTMPDYIEEADGSSYVLYTGSIVLDSPLNEYVLELYDYDSAADDDFMGGVKFVPYSKGNNFPDQLNLAPSNGPVHFKVDVNYNWD